MSMERAQKKTVFLHLMKTGGTTFRKILATIYGDGFHVAVDPALSAVAADLEAYDCVELHIKNSAAGWVYTHTELVREGRWDLLEGRDLFVMVREPVDQVLSHYFSMVRIRERIEPRMKAIGARFPESLEEFLDHRPHFNNQTAFIMAKDQHNGSYATEQDLAEAKAVLLRLQAHVGLTERFADSMSVFERVKQVRVPRYEDYNRTPGRPAAADVPEHLRERIRRQSVLDAGLYAFAQERFEADFAG